MTAGARLSFHRPHRPPTPTPPWATTATASSSTSRPAMASANASRGRPTWPINRSTSDSGGAFIAMEPIEACARSSLEWKGGGARTAAHSRVLQGASIRGFDTERMDVLDSSAQRQRAEVAGPDFRRRADGAERICRCDERASEFARRLLEAPGRVHDVAVEDDRPAHLADLAGDDLAQMQRRTQLGLHAEALDEPVRVRGERRAHREEAAQRPGIGDAVGLDPGDDDLVADVLVDFAAAMLDRLGDSRKHRGEKAMRLQRPEPLGDRGRAHDVD